jgi:hypothetical protein
MLLHCNPDGAAGDASNAGQQRHAKDADQHRSSLGVA